MIVVTGAAGQTGQAVLRQLRARGAAVRAMVSQAGLASAENWAFGDTFTERLRYEVDPKWQGDIPRTVLIGKDGSARTIEGSAAPADLEKWAAGQGAGKH